MDDRPPKEPGADEGDASLRNYAGRWIARIGRQIVGQGGTPTQALYAAKQFRYKETPEIIYIPTESDMSISSQIEHITKEFPADQPIYLVGGAVRDAIIGRVTHDLDFVLAKNSMKIARRVADAMQAAYYPLDESRQTARVIIEAQDSQREVLDFALLRGDDLESDLRARDFTINAMAVDVRDPDRLLDPLGGLADLRAKRLRACSRGAFQDDPVRILRGVRLAAAFGLHILPETRKQMRQAVPELNNVSAERLRDEIFRILDGKQPATSMRALDWLGVIGNIMPELAELKNISRVDPHHGNVWEHTLDLIKRIDQLLGVLGPVHDPDAAATFMLGLVSVQLGRYRDQISAHLEEEIVPGRSRRALLFLAGLYHDSGKKDAMQVEENGRIRFLGYEQQSAGLLHQRSRELRLSNEEIDHAARVVRYHLRPGLADQGKQPSRRAIYRFFRDAGGAGVEICILSMANLWAEHGPAIPQDTWSAHLEVVRALLDAWFENAQSLVHPERLVDGNDLMREFDLPPGPKIGEVLESLREAQAAGEVKDREQALAFIRTLLKKG